ncbi:MAG TPA: DUF4440 domain-containing protein [Rhodothermales bacterium]|nr:DUF4440 domain-containing protein [Rhodothermales bacterium]
MERYADGQMMQAGPFTNNTGGAVILRAESLADAEALVATDPAVVSEVFVATVSPWQWVEWEYHLDRASLRKLQAQFIQHVMHEDVAAPEEMIHPDFVAINSKGTISNREAYLKDEALAIDIQHEYKPYSVTDEEIRLFGNTALVLSEIAYSKGVEGKTVPGHALLTNTYIQENGMWVCIQAKIIPVAER